MKLKQKISYLLSLLAVAVMSSWLTQMATGERRLAVEEAEPVYLIGSVTVNDYERLPDYQAIAGPLAAQVGGYMPLAYSVPNMIQGSISTGGRYFIERYDSLEGLTKFLNSSEFQEAKKLRDEIADVHFMMWLPAVSPDSLPH